MDGFASGFLPRKCDVYLHNARERAAGEHEKDTGDTTREEEDLEQFPKRGKSHYSSDNAGAWSGSETGMESQTY